MEAFFEFEKPIVNLEKKLLDLRELAKQEGVDFASEIAKLEKKVSQLIDETYSKLTPWQRVLLSRHPSRPYTRDYVDLLFPDFMELQGDRTHGDDQAILGGVATWPPQDPLKLAANGNGSTKHGQSDRIPVMILGHQKGRNTKQKMERNFGMAKPEGYRKAIRLMELAERARMPVISFIDTPGAYPSIEAEERGQSQAIAESIHAMFKLTVPTLSMVIGEGGSGGALALGCSSVVLIQEYGVYSVISPEGCAAILWSDSTLAERAAEKLKITPPELIKLGVVDGIVPEPKGGAHRDTTEAASLVGRALIQHLDPLIQGTSKGKRSKATGSATGTDHMTNRLDKFRKMGEGALAHAPIQQGG